MAINNSINEKKLGFPFYIENEECPIDTTVNESNMVLAKTNIDAQ
jgi:hypothetical protein